MRRIKTRIKNMSEDVCPWSPADNTERKQQPQSGQNHSNLLTKKNIFRTPSPHKHDYYQPNKNQQRGRTLSLIKNYLKKHYTDHENQEETSKTKNQCNSIINWKNTFSLGKKSISYHRASIIDMSRSFVEQIDESVKKARKGQNLGSKLLKLKEKLLRNKQMKERGKKVLFIQQNFRPQSKTIPMRSKIRTNCLTTKSRSRHFSKANSDSLLAIT